MLYAVISGTQRLMHTYNPKGHNVTLVNKSRLTMHYNIKPLQIILMEALYNLKIYIYFGY